jgi:hypothetical protein
MTKPNEKFKLNVRDVEQIETALRFRMFAADPKEKQVINELLAKMYHQKNWYRPNNKTYVGG